MSYINENVVLDFYIQQINEDDIKFLQGRDYFKAEIVRQINILRAAQEMHDKIECAKQLWKLLFESAMSFIDPDKEGYDQLFSYFDEYVNFEELIFASDSFYRDHTIHCLWVYFLGEYLYRKEEFGFLYRNMNAFEKYYEYLCDIIEKDDMKEFFNESYRQSKDIIRKYNFDDSVRCISSLTHDLGYPIKKIGKINKSISKMLPYFSIYNYNEFNFRFSELQKNFIDMFLEIMCTDLHFNPFSLYNSRLSLSNEEENAAKKILEKCMVRDKSTFKINGFDKTYIEGLSEVEQEILKEMATPQATAIESKEKYLRYSRDFEAWQHGIMSAFLLIKTLRAFNNIEIQHDYRNLLSSYDIVRSSKSEILTSITDHTSAGYKICGIKTTSDFLILIDELEEFSRISRANQNRQYINEFCKTELYVENNTLNINFIFDNTNIQNLDPERAFKGRCIRMLTLFDIRGMEEDLHIVLRCIGKLPYDDNVYALELGRQYANITINGEEQSIPRYLKSSQFYTKEEYRNMQ